MRAKIGNFLKQGLVLLLLVIVGAEAGWLLAIPDPAPPEEHHFNPFRGKVNPTQYIVFHNRVTWSTSYQLEAVIEASAHKYHYLVLELTTPGGLVEAGYIAARAIERSPIPVICVVPLYAKSMGYYLLQSCQVRFITSSGVLMAHQPSASADVEGKPQVWQDQANDLESTAYTMAVHESRRTYMTLAEFEAKIMNRDWYVYPEEALKLGIVDAIVPSVESVRLEAALKERELQKEGRLKP
jgi:ATP-dependent protease ClpP protease subunit